MAAQTTQRSQPSPMNRQSPATKRLSRHIGRTNFHAKFINWSWRRRGRVPRIQMKTPIETNSFPKNQIHDGINWRNSRGAVHPPRKSVDPKPETENIATYSPRKKRANLKPEYSVWYPATSSDSPSGRSKGERLVSAVPAIAYMINAA